MIFLYAQQTYHAHLRAFLAALEEVPGTDCLRSRQQTFTFTSNRAADHYRRYELSALEMSLLLDRRDLPYPANLRVQALCATEGCVNAEHWRILPARSSKKTPLALPAAMRRPITPQGHAQSGRRNHNTRISEEQAERILRARYQHGWTYQRIADQEGLNARSVVSTCSGKNHRATAQRILPELEAAVAARQS